MKVTQIPQLAALLALPLLAGSVQAALVANWSLIDTNTGDTNIPAFIGGSELTAGPVIGNNTASAADAASIYASFTTISLTSAGDKITLSGSATLTGIAGVSDQFRWGLLDVNGSADLNDWRGYIATASHAASTTSLRERNSGANAFFSSTGATAVGATYSEGSNFVDGTYNFTLSLERLADNSIQANFTLNDGGNYTLSVSRSDTTPQTYSFNRVGFLIGNSLDADQVSFSNVDVTFVPEPTVALLGSLGALGFLRRRRN